MNAEKKHIVKRLIIFCLLSFLPVIIGAVILYNYFKEPFFSEKHASSPQVMLLSSIGMCSLAIANFLTRLITGEGLKDSYLDFSMRDGKWKYYVAAVAVPLAYFLIFMFIAVISTGLPLGEAFDSKKILSAPHMLNLLFFQNIAVLIVYFGEEFGWRAYLTPKLTKLMGEPKAIIVNGIIWGLWHAPLTCNGHNFGTDYPLFPFLGIGLMCIFCIAASPFFTLITNRTGSVIPASIAHLSYNCFINSSSLFMTERAMETRLSFAASIASLHIPVIISGMICFIIILNDRKKKSSAA